MLNHLILLSLFNWDTIPPPLNISLFMTIAVTIGALFTINNSDYFELSNGDSAFKNKIICTIIYSLFALNSFFFFFDYERSRKNAYSTKNRIKYEENIVDHILANLLPPFVRSRFNSCKIIYEDQCNNIIFKLAGNACIEED